ncbi:MAG TPA: CYTH and CHAD domain-containing protein [Actinomycetota bacterium]|nr:CYTH and CHAD domain-containing protein [Actinomycetota bacterium]
MYEREVKLSAPAGFRWPGFGDETALVATPLAKRTYQTAYFDTPDLRLARWGCSLRHRSGEGWTLKLPSSNSGSDSGGHGAGRGPLLVRGEYTFEGEANRPPEAALSLVTAYVRGSETKPVARLRTVREPVRLDAADGTQVAEMVLDEVSVLEGRRLVERFREIEVEVTPGTSAETLRVILSALKAAGAVATDPVPKYARALGTRAWLPPEVVVGEVGQLSTAGQLVRNAIAASVDRYLRQEPGVRLGEDPEAVHQARVATRRLRSDLRTFASLLEETWERDLGDKLRWLGGLLGGARDADVLHARIRTRADSLPDDDRPAGAKLAAELTSDQQRARVQLLAGLGEDGYIPVLQSLVDAARSPRLLPEAHQGAHDVALRLLAKPWRKLRQEVRSLDDPPKDEALHEVRIRAKRVRYAAEAVAPVLGRRATRFARAAAELQEILGEHHDAVVMGQLLRERGIGAPAEVAFAAGELAGLERAAADRARGDWPAAWKRLRKVARAMEL